MLFFPFIKFAVIVLMLLILFFPDFETITNIYIKELKLLVLYELLLIRPEICKTKANVGTNRLTFSKKPKKKKDIT